MGGDGYIGRGLLGPAMGTVAGLRVDRVVSMVLKGVGLRVQGNACSTVRRRTYTLSLAALCAVPLPQLSCCRNLDLSVCYSHSSHDEVRGALLPATHGDLLSLL